MRRLCLVKKQKLHATPALERKQKRVTRTVLSFSLPMALTRDRDSELSTEGIQSGQGRGECIYGVLRFNPSTASLGKMRDPRYLDEYIE